MQHVLNPFVETPEGYHYGQLCFEYLHELPSENKISEISEYEYYFALFWMNEHDRIFNKMFGG